MLKGDLTLCLCNSNMAWGGGESWHMETARELARRGRRVFLAAGARSALGLAARRLLDKETELRPYLRLYNFRFNNLDFLHPLKLLRFARFLRVEGVRTVLAGLPADMKGLAMAVRLLPPELRPAVYYRRGSALPVRSTRLNRFFYGSLRGLIANSRESARYVLHSGLLTPEKVHVIYNGLNGAEFDGRLGALPVEKISAPFWVQPERPLVIGNAGRLTAQKGQAHLLRMSSLLKQRGVRHRLILAGVGELGAELRLLADCLGLERGEGMGTDKELCFAGFLEDMSLFWRSIDVFALSSLWEGFGYVLAEAMLASKPLCAFNCNSIPELVRHGHNGFLAAPPRPGEPEDAAAERLAELILRLRENPEQMRAMGQAGRSFCLENFDMERALNTLLETLEFKEAKAG